MNPTQEYIERREPGGQMQGAAMRAMRRHRGGVARFTQRSLLSRTFGRIDNQSDAQSLGFYFGGSGGLPRLGK